METPCTHQEIFVSVESHHKSLSNGGLCVARCTKCQTAISVLVHPDTFSNIETKLVDIERMLHALHG
jgi:hypothetical protein